jgi:hypothetical protein
MYGCPISSITILSKEVTRLGTLAGFIAGSVDITGKRVVSSAYDEEAIGVHT